MAMKEKRKKKRPTNFPPGEASRDKAALPLDMLSQSYLAIFMHSYDFENLPTLFSISHWNMETRNTAQGKRADCAKRRSYISSRPPGLKFWPCRQQGRGVRIDNKQSFAPKYTRHLLTNMHQRPIGCGTECSKSSLSTEISLISISIFDAPCHIFPYSIDSQARVKKPLGFARQLNKVIVSWSFFQCCILHCHIYLPCKKWEP